MPLPLSFSQWCVTPSDKWNDDENYVDDNADDHADDDADDMVWPHLIIIRVDADGDADGDADDMVCDTI